MICYLPLAYGFVLGAFIGGGFGYITLILYNVICHEFENKKEE